jgi:type I restriction enzyme, S subunit
VRTGTVQLGQICEFVYGESLKEEKRRPGKIPVYGSNGVVGWHEHAITSGPTIVIGRKGSIGEVNWSNGPCFPIDTTYYVERTKKPCDLRWLFFILQKLDLPRLNKSAAVPGLNRDDAYEQLIPFPDLYEQQRISAQLDQTDRLRRMRRYARELSDTLLPSIFLELFGDPRTNPNGYPVHELGEYILFLTSGSRGWAQHYSQKGARFIRSLDVQMNEISNTGAVYVIPPANAEARRTQVQTGDVLLTITGSRIGRVAPVMPYIGEAYVSQHVAIIRINNELLPEYLSMFLSHELGGQLQIAKVQYGQTKPGLNLDQIREFKAPIPILSDQLRFRRILHKYEQLKLLHLEAQRQAEQLFQTLLHQSFTGELTPESQPLRATILA